MDKTVPAVARITGLSEAQVRRTVEKLGDMDPPLVQRLEDAGLNIEFWSALEAAAEPMDEADTA